MSAPVLQRDRELSALAHGLDGVATGRGGLTVISGPLGIGKTTLLAMAAARARERGLTVLTARGAALESAYPYAVVRRLFEPLGLDRDAAPPDLVTGAAALATRAFRPDAGLTGDPFATVHGLYWLTVNLSARAPVLLAVDDCHWADEPSLRFLAYLAARLDGLPVGLLVTTRTGEPATAPALLAELTLGGVAVRPTELEPAAAASLVRTTVGDRASDRFCHECHRATGGNPLLLSLLLAAVAADERRPDDESAADVQSLAAASVGRVLSHRLAHLPPGAGAVTTALAVLGQAPPVRHLAELSTLDMDTTTAALEALRASGVVGPDLDFAHPVLRVAVDEAMSDADRARAHAAAAAMLARDGADPERQAVHLLRTPPRGDAAVVVTLAAAARSAVERGAPETAAAYLHRALDEPAPAAHRDDLRFELGLALLSARRDAAAPAMLRAATASDGAALRAVRSLGVAGFFADVAQFEPFLDGGAGLTARMLEAEILAAAWLTADRVPMALARSERWLSTPVPDDFGGKQLLVNLAHRSAISAEPAAVASDLLHRALAGNELLGVESLVLIFVAMDLVVVDQLDLAERVCDAAIECGQRTGSPSMVASFLFPRAFARLGRGALADAEADARWSFDLKRAMGPDGAYAWPLGFLVEALVERGDLAGARAALATCPDGPPPETMGWALVIQARGRLHLAAGDPAAAVEDLRDAGARFERLACRGPGLARWRADLALALARLGKHDDARDLAGEFARLAQATGLDRLGSVAARTLAAVSPPGEREPLLREAVTLAAHAPLDRAYALIELGAHLRRTGYRGAARDPLRLGLDLAHRLGAVPLAARARDELVAAGGRPRRPAVSGVDALTASERRVTALAVDGLSNREIAERLFVTQRTVETHLSHAFTKLGVRRRDQLARHGLG